MSYPGILLLSSHLKKQDYNFLFDRLHKCLDGWKRHHLSRVGRLIPIHSILASPNIHVLTNTSIPSSVLNDVEKLFKAFLQRHQSGVGRLILYGKIKFAGAKCNGGLGLQQLKFRREAFMGKSTGSLIIKNLNEDSICHSQVATKYNFSGCYAHQPRRDASTMWKSICSASKWVQQSKDCQIGDGMRINALQDPWFSNTPIPLRPILIQHQFFHDDQKVPDLMNRDEVLEP